MDTTTTTSKPTNGATPTPTPVPTVKVKATPSKGELSLDKRIVSLARRAAENEFHGLETCPKITTDLRVKSAIKMASRVVFAAIQEELKALLDE